MPNILEAQSLHFRIGHKVILENISLTLATDEILTIVGPNGAGKSSLLRLLIGLEKPTQGKIIHHKALHFGYMPQRLQLNTLMPLSAGDFIHLGHSKNTRISTTVQQQLFMQLNIQNVLKHSMHELSGGERQRVLLARALMQAPDILVLDEPAQGVDISGQNRLYELINDVRRIHPCAVLMVSHDLHHVMATTDRVICLNQHICCQGHPDSVTSSDEFSALFGDAQMAALRHYTHHHDHHHDLHGDVIAGSHHDGCQHDH
ncbi:MAG: metal ABC transporter ATP-binding protein [Pseudomonadales bacterium]|nr:metal ABC transporter ATP-binding protein [Pseudomonadales bacterium]